jgi:hypothetical protein
MKVYCAAAGIDDFEAAGHSGEDDEVYVGRVTHVI